MNYLPLTSRLRLLGALCSCFLLAGTVRAQQAEWAQLIDSRAVLASQQVTDAAGNTTLALEFADSLKVAGFRLTTTGAQDIDLALLRLTADGRVQWVKQLGGPGRDGLGALAVDAGGALHVSGSNAASFRAGAYTLPAAGAFLTVLDSRGTVIAARTLWHQRSSSALFMTAMAVDAAGTRYLAGAATNVDSLGTAQMPVSPRRYSFVAAISAAGQTTWIVPLRSVGWGGAQSTLLDMKAAPGGGCVVGGYFRGELLIDHATPIQLSQLSTASRALVVALGPAGQPQWAKASTGGGPAGAYGLGIGPAGEVYLTGNASADSVRFDGAVVPNRGTFLFRFSATGTALWGRGAAQPGSHSGTGVAVDAAGNPYLVGTLFGTSVTFGRVRLIDYSPNAGQAQSSQLFVVGYSPQGEVRWGKIQQERAHSVTSGYSIGTDASGQLYVLGSGNGRYDDTDVQRTFLLKIRPTAHITGMVYLDGNANGYRDANEPAFPQSLVLQPTARPDMAVTNATSGYFDLNTDTGTVVLHLPQVPPHYRLTEGASGHLSFLTTMGEVDSLRRFGLAPLPNEPDLQLAFTAYAAPRPGFITRSRLTVTNVGTTTVAPNTLYTDLDPNAAFVSSSPAPTAVSGNQLSWQYAALPPLAQRTYDVQFSLPVNVPAGTALRTSARVPLATDLVQTNNEDSLRQQVTVSTAPNSIEVSHPQLTLAQVSSQQPIDYTIRFQNTGADTAITIVIRDTLNPQMFQLSTVRYIGSSHSCTWSLRNGVLIVRLTAINQPPRDVDILRSLGFVRFRMTPWTTLTNGTIIPNRASIFFDLNPPLATNTVTTIVGTSSGVGLAEETAAPPCVLYPNPARDGAATLTTQLTAAGTVQVELLDLLGRSLRHWRVANAPSGAFEHRLDVRALPAGTYVVRLKTPNDATTSRRLVVP